MNYSLHPEAERDLRDAAEFYRERAGISLSQSFFGGVREGRKQLVAVSRTGFALAREHASLCYESLPVFSNPYSLRRRDSPLCSSSPQSPPGLLAQEKVVPSCGSHLSRSSNPELALDAASPSKSGERSVKVLDIERRQC